MELNKDQTFSLSPEVLFQEVSGEIVLLDLASDNYFGLDEVGARIWKLFSEGNTLGAVLNTLEEEYDVEREVLEKDVSELVEELAGAGLIKV